MKRPLSSLALLASIGVLVGACDDATTAPEGTPSTIRLRAYVDADGSGSFDDGDAALEGLTVTLAAAGDGATLQESTDARGLAVFADVAPGSYRASLEGTPPDGAVLASASAPTVEADFQGGEVTAEFRYVYRPGSISGVIFRDDDGSGSFEGDQDTPAPGMGLELHRGADASGEAVASTQTSGEGAFTFDELRPGDYTLRIEPFETTEIVGGNTVGVSVSPDAATEVAVEFTGSVVVPVSDARTAPEGRTVTVEGTVSWQAQWDADNRSYYVQDGSAGIAVFDGDGGPALEVGDRVRVTGSRGAFRGEVQISPVSNVEILGFDGPPDPRVASAAEIAAGNFQGQLVAATGTVQNVITLSFDNQVVELADPAGDPLTVFVDSRTGVSPGDWTEGEAVILTGVLTTADFDGPPIEPGDRQLEIRFPDDRVAVSAISDARGAAEGTVVAVEGTVTWHQQWDSRVYYFQDASGGVTTFDFNEPDVQRGDRIRVRGELGSFRGEVQLSPVDFTIVAGQPGVPAPRTVTASEIAAGQFQGELVELTGTVQSVSVINSFGTHVVELTDGAGDGFTVFVDNRTGVSASDWETGSEYRVSGVLVTADFDDPPPEPEDRQLEVREPGDMEKIG